MADNVHMPAITRFLRAAALCALGGAPLAAPAQSPAAAEVTEYVNEITRHFVLITRPEEKAAIEAGAAGPGWRRTGYVFQATAGGTLGRDGAVCRFYSPRYNSHFFTGNAAECLALRQPGSEWVFEEIAFTAQLAGPASFACGLRDVAVHRLYNNRHAQGDANHRFAWDPEVRQLMVADGWTDEGPAFCFFAPRRLPERSDALIVERIDSRPACESRVGGCVALSQLPAMTGHVERFFPIHFLTNPEFPFISDYVLGRAIGDFWASNPSAPVWRTRLEPGVSVAGIPSFVQLGGSQVGVFVNGPERGAGPYASLTPMQELPGTGERVFPWRVFGDRQLVVRAELSLGMLELLAAGSHAYAHPMIQFADAASGRSFFVTIQAVGSLAEGDFVGPDANRGWAIVSTSFRAQPLFGQRISGQYTRCVGTGKNDGCLAEARPFAFGLRRADFVQVLARARAVDPALSANPEDYFVANFAVHAETYLEARIALNVHRLALELWYAGRYDPSAR